MLHFEGETWTQGAFLREVQRLSGCFSRLGVTAGSRVVLMLENSPELLFSAFASHQLGSIAVPINPRCSVAEMDYVINDVEPSLIVSEGPMALGRIANLTRDGFRSDRGDLPSEQDRRFTGGPAAGDAAFLFYTSGTTSHPKGVLLSHRNILACLESLRQAWHWQENDRLLLVLPLFHVHGLIVAAHGSVWNGSEIVLHRKFDVEETLRDLQQYGCTLFMGVPTMYQRLLEAGATAGSGLRHQPFAAEQPHASLDSIRLFVSGSAPLPASTHGTFKRMFGHAILERYGMTETLMVLSNPYDGPRKAGSVGVPLPGVEVCLVDDSRQQVEKGDIGEIWVRGKAVFHQYWKNPNATRASFDQGWFKTGDVAYQDEEGHFFIVGRKSVDIIKCYGFKISAREIEDVLLELPSVAEVAVVGVPHTDKGEEIVAFVMPQQRVRDRTETCVEMGAAQLESVLREDVIGFLHTRLAHYKHPSRYFLVDALPRNTMGKVSKIDLKKRKEVVR
ncbi:MAG: AMP-binding protein [Acidobacteria bacterium]|nr:AMP-binding protein [Acidobacteriota bacterium]